MKHNLKITIVLLVMFFITQLIGLAVLKADPLKLDVLDENGEVQQAPNPALSWIQPPEPETQGDFWNLFLTGLLPAFIIAVILLFLLMKFKIEVFLRLWFFAVVCIALFIAIIAIEKIVPWTLTLKTGMIIAVILSIPLAFIKIYKKNLLVHNFTELLIYPGIAVVFVPLLNIYTIVALLIIISAYDMWAVWHSGVMQKMAKYQINNLKIFSGFFVPYLSKSQRAKLKKLREAEKSKKSKSKPKSMKVNIAILGGGDIVFPIITAGVMMATLGFLAAFLTIVGATLGLGYLFFFAEKKKFYPAMPFITSGMFIAMIVAWILTL